MDTLHHTLTDLFRQLGLPDSPADAAAWIACHRPLPAGVALADAPWWQPGQASFLREAIACDADWAEAVDALALALGP